jgi:modulator of FtsH protease HflC
MAEQNRRNAASMILAVLVIAAFGLYMVAFEVPFTHTAVVTRFGEVKDTFSGSKADQVGLRFKAPWPIDQVTLFDNRVRVYESKLEQLFTADEQSITVTVYTAWRIGADREDVLRFLKVVGTPENAEAKLAGMAHDAMGKVVGVSSFESFINTDAQRMKFAAIEKDLYDRMSDQARKTYGIEVMNDGIKRLELPEEATKKVFERMKQEREQLAEKYRAEGDSQARQIRSQADRLANDIENRAKAEAIAITGQGDVEAAKYYNVFAQNPELHNFIKRLESLKEILPQRSTLILDADRVPPFDLLSSKSLKGLTETPIPATTTPPATK